MRERGQVISFMQLNYMIITPCHVHSLQLKLLNHP